MDGQTDGRTDERTDGPTDERTNKFVKRRKAVDSEALNGPRLIEVIIKPFYLSGKLISESAR